MASTTITMAVAVASPSHTHPSDLMKKPVSFFLAEYDPIDPIGYLLAFLSFTPPFLVAIQTSVYFTLLVVSVIYPGMKACKRASLLAGKLLLGQLINELLNLTLKNILQHPRPESSYKDYGMPSSHSQFMAFLSAIFPALARSTCKLLKFNQLSILSIISANYLGTFLIAYGRVYLGYHSIDQVLAGLFIGYTFGLIWYSRYISGN